MSVESFIQAMPKVELGVHLEGTMSRRTLEVIAEQNDIPENDRRYAQWLALLDKPDYQRLDDILRELSRWLLHPDDLARIVYEYGVGMAKQNIRYAEVYVNPLLYLENGFTFEQLLAALNDGRDRAERGWKVRLAWVLVLPRDQIRKADDYLRWTTSVAARKGRVVGLALVGSGSGSQSVPLSQYERVFRSAEKKQVARAVYVYPGDDLAEAISSLAPDRIHIGRSIDANFLQAWQHAAEQQVYCDVSVAQAVRHNLVTAYSAYPLRQLLDEGVKLTLSSRSPALYKCSLAEEYLAAVQECGIGVDELELLGLNAALASWLPNDEKETLLEEMRTQYSALRAQHLEARSA